MNMDRKVGLDLEATKLVLADVAQFHALFLALKLQKPEMFNKNVRPYLQNFEMPLGPGHIFVENFFKEIAKEDEEVLKLVPKIKRWSDVRRSETRELFATVVHADLWTTNTMQIIKDGKAVANKLVDFQVCTYGSPASDVFSLFWTSVQKSVLEDLDSLLEFYYKEFIKNLKDYNCDTDCFSYEKFLNEMRLEAEYEFPHSFQYLCMVSVADNEDTMFGDVIEIAKRAPQFSKEKIFYMVKECNKRGWLY